MTGLHDRHLAVSPEWLALYYRHPLELTHGEGRHVWDADGNRYLDFFGGILTTMTAHALPEVTKAVAEQAGRIIHSSTLYLNRPMVEMAERIATLSGIPDARVFFTTSGTEANDTALLLATAYRRSNQILAMRNSYHGRSFSTVSITGNQAWSPTSLSPLQTLYVHGGVRSRGPYAELSDERFIQACVADLEDLLGHTRHGRPDRRTRPGRRRLHLAARRPLRRVPGGPGPARGAVDLGRGADRLGPYR